MKLFGLVLRRALPLAPSDGARVFKLSARPTGKSAAAFIYKRAQFENNRYRRFVWIAPQPSLVARIKLRGSAQKKEVKGLRPLCRTPPPELRRRHQIAD